MVNELLPVEVDPNSADAAFWSRYHVFRRARHAETRPDDPILPDSVAEVRMRTVREFEIHVYYEITSDGEMLGWFSGHTVRPGSPGYDENRDFFDADIEVAREHRRQGIGTRLLLVALDVMDRHGCRLLDLWADEEAGHAFLRRFAGEPKFVGAENRLDLAAVDWGMVRRWVEEGAERSPGTHLQLIDGPIPEAMLDEYAPQLARLLNSIPWDDLAHGEIVITPAHVREVQARMALTNTMLHTIVARDPDGTIAGITDVSYTRHLPTLVEQRFTGVSPEARGRGIGKWIKAAMLEKLHTEYPQARWMVTGNASSNGPMLSINHRLGFFQYRAGAEYQVSRDRLAEIAGRS
jgi:GNAT superfamily N-acetyltransferase